MSIGFLIDSMAVALAIWAGAPGVGKIYQFGPDYFPLYQMLLGYGGVFWVVARALPSVHFAGIIMQSPKEVRAAHCNETARQIKTAVIRGALPGLVLSLGPLIYGIGMFCRHYATTRDNAAVALFAFTLWYVLIAIGAAVGIFIGVVLVADLVRLLCRHSKAGSDIGDIIWARLFMYELLIVIVAVFLVLSGFYLGLWWLLLFAIGVFITPLLAAKALRIAFEEFREVCGRE